MVSTNCKHIEELIINQSNHSLTRQEIQSIQLHIKNCASCRAFGLSIKKINTEMAPDKNEFLKPNPAILENIHKKMSEKPVFAKMGLINIIDVVRSVLEYRIPVYQAGLVMGIIFLLIFGLDFSQSLKVKNEIEPEGAQNFENRVNDVFMVENHPVLSEQKVGVNAREDSILIRYIHTSM